MDNEPQPESLFGIGNSKAIEIQKEIRDTLRRMMAAADKPPKQNPPPPPESQDN